LIFVHCAGRDFQQLETAPLASLHLSSGTVCCRDGTGSATLTRDPTRTQIADPVPSLGYTVPFTLVHRTEDIQTIHKLNTTSG